MTTLRPKDRNLAFFSRITRRGLLLGAGAVGIESRIGVAQTLATKIDHTIRIAPASLEIASGKIIKTAAYNGTVPGPALRLQEGKPVAINVINDSGYPNLIHWHGLYNPSNVDGATEEGSPIIPSEESLLYAFTPRPTGTRWYHSHAMAMTDLNRSTYTGEFGFFIIEPATGDPGRYDREVMLAAHHWEGAWVSMQDIRKGPPPDNGLEVMYHAATLGERTLGHGEPIRVRQGERVLFRLLNASGNMGISLALPGHRFMVIAMDGNPVAAPATADVLKLDVAERVDVIVEMNNPGVWIFGSADDDDRNMGMGVVVEYENQSGEPRGKRYRLVMNNNSGDTHPVHMHRHTFEITKVGDRATSGVMKDTISMPRYSTAEIDFVADDPGDTLFHCHHQDHMDEGFAGLITYT
jgi:FtsP/CotA-like multicopper oxidase with cupredoxin domain